MKQNTNWRAMQSAGAAKHKLVTGPLPGPGGVKTKYMTMGSWKQDLSKVKLEKQ